MPDKMTVFAGRHEVRLEGPLGPFSAELTSELTSEPTSELTAERPAEGLAVVRLVLAAPSPAEPPRVQLIWRHPVVDVQATWHPGIERGRGLSPDWAGGGQTTRATSGAPVRCLHNLAGRNRLTFACSDAMNALRLSSGVREETAELICRVELFVEPCPPTVRYELLLRLDCRDVPYWQALRDVSDWWAAMEGFQPAPVPEAARLPMYSTWYSFHQRLNVEAVLRQCALAGELGCRAVIVDDGWQTTDSSRGYAYCGDWLPERIGDMAGFIRRVHDLGMKFILWYSVPHAGIHSRAWRDLAGKFLYTIESHGAAILDPRFPDVREYLIARYEQAMRRWDLDGLKLDFVDCFHPTRDTPPARDGDGRDCAGVPQAADRLLSDIIARLRRIKPDVMVEFRQSYVGPLMRKYGNMFRAGDCPNDAVTNRLRTLDIRLLCGRTAAHADMLMWHPADTVAAAAIQVLGVLFAVPQISVLLDQVPHEHVQMLRFWLGFWREHRDCLLDGDLAPQHPESLYPAVVASAGGERIVAIYDDAVANPGPGAPDQLLLVNATHAGRIILDLGEPLGRRRLRTFDACGRKVSQARIRLSAGLRAIPVPPAGLAILSR